MSSVYVLFRGSDHEGGGVQSIHATEAGAVTAAEAIMDADRARDAEARWRPGGLGEPKLWWRALYRPVLSTTGDLGNWQWGEVEDSCDYMCVRAWELLP